MSAERINIYEVDSAYYMPLIELDKKLRKSSITLNELLLIYIRASQINGCAYCVQLHIKEAIKKGEKQHRLHALVNWEDTPFFTNEEEVILKVTEEITTISERGLSNQTYERAKQLFNEAKIADIIMAVTCINSWNRIGRATLLIPEES